MQRVLNKLWQLKADALPYGELSTGRGAGDFSTDKPCLSKFIPVAAGDLPVITHSSLSRRCSSQGTPEIAAKSLL